MAICIVPQRGAAFTPIQDRIAKIGKTRFPECVAVADRAIYVDQFLATDPLSHFVSSHFGPSDHVGEAILPRPQCHKGRRRKFGNSEIIVGSLSVGSKLINPDMACSWERHLTARRQSRQAGLAPPATPRRRFYSIPSTMRTSRTAPSPSAFSAAS